MLPSLMLLRSIALLLSAATHSSIPLLVKPSPPSHYDLLVIGGGSGGLACAKRAAGYGATVGIIEAGRFGGTCVNVGCVPKKVMYNASHVAETLHDAHNFGSILFPTHPPPFPFNLMILRFTVGETSFDWALLKRYRDRYIERLNRIYETGLDKTNVRRPLLLLFGSLLISCRSIVSLVMAS